MSNENNWEEEDTFTDMPEAAQTDAKGKPNQEASQLPQFPKQIQTTAPRPLAPVYQPPAPTEEEFYEEGPEQSYNQPEEELEEDFDDVLSDAHLRLEQGSLYKMLMNHNMFDGVEADPKAIQNVQKEIRKFAKERMETMLGMRPEATPSNVPLEFASPFNALEIEVLKSLASTATKGATETEEANQLVQATPKRNTLKPIGTPAPARRPQAPKVAQNAPKRPLSTKPTTPVKRTKMDLTIDQIAREEGIPRELLEMDVPGVGGKPIAEMTPSELLERDKLIAQRRQGSVKSSSALPMATPEQAELLAAAQVASVSKSPLMARLVQQVQSMPIKNQ